MKKNAGKILFTAACVFLVSAAFAFKREEIELKFICPIDNREVKITRVKTERKFAAMLDGQSYGVTVSPVSMPKCPEDGFVIYKDGFSEKEISILKPYVLSEEYAALSSSETDYWLIYKLQDKIFCDTEEKIESVRRATWEAYNAVDYDKYLFYADEAIRLISSLDDPSADTVFLKGELYRRTGQFKKAYETFSGLKNKADKNSLPAKMIEQEMALIKEEITSTQRAAR